MEHEKILKEAFKGFSWLELVELAEAYVAQVGAGDRAGYRLQKLYLTFIL